jgi:hypothetical protein
MGPNPSQAGTVTLFLKRKSSPLSDHLVANIRRSGSFHDPALCRGAIGLFVLSDNDGGCREPLRSQTASVRGAGIAAPGDATYFGPEFNIQLVEIEAAFKTMKDDLHLRPIYHQLEQRIEAHIFVAFLAYCLHVTLHARLKPLAPGLSPRAVLDKFAAIQMLDVPPTAAP